MSRARILLAAAALLAAAGLGLACLHAWGRPIQVQTKTELAGVPPELTAILYDAALAPNSHNAQSWRVQLDLGEQRLDLGIDPKRRLAVVDAMDREAYLSLGCYLANLELALEAYGYGYQLSWAEDEAAAYLVSVRWSKVKEAEPEALEALEALLHKRHTDKRPFEQRAIAPEVMERLTGPAVYGYAAGSEGFAYLQGQMAEAVKQQAQDQAYRDELAQWLRFSDQEALTAQDGLPAEQLGLAGLAKTFYYGTTDAQSARGDKFAQQGVDLAVKQAAGCGALLVFTGQEGPREWIETGRLLEQTWLACTEAGLSVQPMSALLEQADLRGEAQAALGLTQPLQAILRLGYTADYGAQNGIRRDLDQYVTVIP